MTSELQTASREKQNSQSFEKFPWESLVSWKNIFAKKDIEILLAEMGGEHRLHRVLGPVSLTALGIGCIIGAGIFVLTGVAAADMAGPSIILSFSVAAMGCALAAMCYAEFASMAPVAGSVYTYTYATLGEIFAWIIGWDLILEYSMGCAAVAASWGGHLNELLAAVNLPQIPAKLCSTPFTNIPGTTEYGWINLPAVLIMIFVTGVLVIGIRESARTNALLVAIKLGVVFFVIGVGAFYVKSSNWTSIPVTERTLPQERGMPKLANDFIQKKHLPKEEEKKAASLLLSQLKASYRLEWTEQEMRRMTEDKSIASEESQRLLDDARKKYGVQLPTSEIDRAAVAELLPEVRKDAETRVAESWGLIGKFGVNKWLIPIDDAIRSPFAPYGLSGILLGASIVFFAFIGFDSISTHAEEAIKPQRDVPLGIIFSLLLCTVLYIAVAGVITGIVPYYSLDVTAPIAVAFHQRAAADGSVILKVSSALIAAGGLAGMTSVLLVLFLSQARVFMAMARDGLLPQVFGRIHPKWRTPHVATITTGAVISCAAAFGPIRFLAEMVNIGTLMAFVMVCAAVLILRVRTPELKRPFRCPAIFIVAPLGILVNLILMLFQPNQTWERLVIWLVIGLVIYFCFSRSHSRLTRHLLHEISQPGVDEEETQGAT